VQDLHVPWNAILQCLFIPYGKEIKIQFIIMKLLCLLWDAIIQRTGTTLPYHECCIQTVFHLT
jgi:hypothetical protein